MVCGDGDRKMRDKKKLIDAEAMSQDPFVRKRMDNRDKTNERGEVQPPASHGNVAASAYIL
jgi:hypothetical protein